MWVEVQAGYRLPCPANCSADVYTLMLKCWSADPKERPIFQRLTFFFRVRAAPPSSASGRLNSMSMSSTGGTSASSHTSVDEVNDAYQSLLGEGDVEIKAMDDVVVDEQKTARSSSVLVVNKAFGEPASTSLAAVPATGAPAIANSFSTAPLKKADPVVWGFGESLGLSDIQETPERAGDDSLDGLDAALFLPEQYMEIDMTGQK